MERYNLALTSKEPQMPQGLPNWWHHHGSKMHLDETAPRGLVIIKNNAAELKISRTKTDQLTWDVNWRIKYSPRESASGMVIMETDTLMSAFGLQSITAEESKWLIERYGGEAAKQGAFIRWGDFLNIPGPGTGNDGDPNISILLDKKIKYIFMASFTKPFLI